MCVVWRENNLLSLLHKLGPLQTVPVIQSPELKHLQAIVVTPNEDAVIFIRSSWKVTNPFKGKQLESKISCARIVHDGNNKVLGSISKEEDLRYYLDKPTKCDVVIEAHTSTTTKVRVLIAHSNGNFEAKVVMLPPIEGV